MKRKERLKPLSLFGYDLKEAIRAILSVDPKKMKSKVDGDQDAREKKAQKRPKETLR